MVCSEFPRETSGTYLDSACMADFSQVPEMMQNQANFASILLIIWRNELKAIKYRESALSALEKRVLA